MRGSVAVRRETNPSALHFGSAQARPPRSVTSRKSCGSVLVHLSSTGSSMLMPAESSSETNTCHQASKIATQTGVCNLIRPSADNANRSQRHNAYDGRWRGLNSKGSHACGTVQSTITVNAHYAAAPARDQALSTALYGDACGSDSTPSSLSDQVRGYLKWLLGRSWGWTQVSVTDAEATPNISGFQQAIATRATSIGKYHGDLNPWTTLIVQVGGPEVGPPPLPHAPRVQNYEVNWHVNGIPLAVCENHVQHISYHSTSAWLSCVLTCWMLIGLGFTLRKRCRPPWMPYPWQSDTGGSLLESVRYGRLKNLFSGATDDDDDDDHDDDVADPRGGKAVRFQKDEKVNNWLETCRSIFFRSAEVETLASAETDSLGGLSTVTGSAPSTTHGHGSSNSGDPPRSSHGRGNASRNTPRSSGKRKIDLSSGRTPYEDRESDERDGPPKRPRPHSPTNGPDGLPPPRYACPFSKLYPIENQHCSGTSRRNPWGGWCDVHRLKEHIKRVHYIEDPQADPKSYITADAKARIDVRAQRSQSDFEKWYSLCQALWPQLPEAELPSSPYIFNPLNPGDVVHLLDYSPFQEQHNSFDENRLLEDAPNNNYGDLGLEHLFEPPEPLLLYAEGVALASRRTSGLPYNGSHQLNNEPGTPSPTTDLLYLGMNLADLFPPAATNSLEATVPFAPVGLGGEHDSHNSQSGPKGPQFNANRGPPSHNSETKRPLSRGKASDFQSVVAPLDGHIPLDNKITHHVPDNNSLLLENSRLREKNEKLLGTYHDLRKAVALQIDRFEASVALLIDQPQKKETLKHVQQFQKILEQYSH